MIRAVLLAGALLAASPTTLLPGRPASVSATAAAAVTKHALIVAIGEYAPGTGWQSISSLNDVALVKAALLRQGFTEGNIRVVTDKAATKAGIVRELQALAGRVQPADVVVFHYSGHGQQIADDNGDETDGYDEALVPYDAAMNYKKGVYEGQNHLRDEELGALLGAVRQKVGPKGEVLTVLDACHSGTGTRGLAKHRGTQEVFAPPGYKPTEPVQACAQGCSFGASEGSGGSGQAPMVCYFGASPNQLNFETTDPHGNGVGSLSLAFSNALTSATTAPTYESLFDRIKGEMAATAPTQTPQVEGNTNSRVFQGQTLTLPPHFKPTSWNNDQELTIDGGSLQGLYENSTVALYPPDTEVGATTPPLATGRVTNSRYTSATVALDKPLTGAARQAWVVVTNRSFGAISLNMRLNVADAKLKAQLLDSLRSRPFVKITNTATGRVDLLVEQQPDKPRQLVTSHDQVIPLGAAANTPAGFVHEVLEAATAMAQTKYIRSLQTEAEGLQLKLELVPVTVKQSGGYAVVDKTLPASAKSTGTGGTVYNVGDYMQLKVTNEGRKRAYFTLLDIQPDNQMTVLLPSAKRQTEQAEDYVVEAGKVLLLPNIIRIGPPFGQEVFKLIASEKPMDLRPLVRSRGSDGSRGADNPFVGLLQKSYKATGTRGGEDMAIPAEAVTITDIVFQIADPTRP